MPDRGACPAILAENVNWWSGWKLIADFTTIDLIAAEANARNGAPLAQRPDHHQNFTAVGVALMALVMGLGGDMTAPELGAPSRRPDQRLRRRSWCAATT
jgi:hypothetical protein